MTMFMLLVWLRIQLSPNGRYGRMRFAAPAAESLVPVKFEIFCSVAYISMKGRIGDRHSFTGWFGAQI